MNLSIDSRDHQKNNLMMEADKKLIVVIGMHRSGTSAITKSLECAGVDLGNKLMPPGPNENDLGFFEDIDIVQFNENLLKECGKNWYDTQKIDYFDTERLIRNGYLLQGIELLRNKIHASNYFGFKDPRTAALLPFWEQIFATFEFEVFFLLATRNPLSIVRSLQQRNEFEPEQGYYLWINYILQSLSFLKNKNFISVNYDKLLADPHTQVMRIASLIGNNIDYNLLEQYCKQFLRTNLRHWAYNENDLMVDSNRPPKVLEIYQYLRQFEDNNFNSTQLDKSIIEDWQIDHEKTLTLNRLVDKQYTLLCKRKEDNHEAVAWAQQLDNELIHTRDNLKQVSNDHEKAVAWAQQLDNQLLDIKHTNYLEVKNLARKIETIEFMLSLEKNQNNALLNSTCWRITYPIRHIKEFTSSTLRAAKCFAAYNLKLIKATYCLLPINEKVKLIHRSAINRISPSLLLASGSPSNTVFTRKQETSQLDIQETLPINSEKNIETPLKISMIQFSVHKKPLVSIIIPVYGQIRYTLACLESIAQTKPCYTYEIIIIDDFSPDESCSILETQISGVKLIKNTENKGFIQSCNIGAEQSLGEFLYFLNNDTLIHDGSLDALVRTFTDFPGTGLVGSKLLYPDGVLQEAGGILWEDGSAWNFGRYQDASLPIYNYAREVDYCSGASIMIPRKLFVDIGGFDIHYAPAYCEDSDIALKIRTLGYRVIYQPLSTITHYEGTSSGTDTSQGVKSYQIENSKKLLERWKSTFASHSPNGLNVDNEKDRSARWRVLILDHCTPTPDQDAGSVTAFNIMLLMREMKFQVTFIPEDNFLYMPEHTVALQRNGIEVLYSPYVTSVDQHLKEYGSRYHIVLFVRPTVVERNLEHVKSFCPKAKLMFETCDLHYLRMLREAELEDSIEKQELALKMKELEFQMIKSVDLTILRSTAELELLKDELPNNKLCVFPLILTPYKNNVLSLKERKDIIFVGGFQHTPNVDAVKYFVSSIMPILRKLVPDIRFHVVGSNVPDEIRILESADVKVIGYVKNLISYLSNIRVSVAPLRYGAGIKGKIGTAMCAGIPVVATSIAIEGMDLINGEHVLVEDEPYKFASAIANVYQDTTLWDKLSSNAFEFAKNTWGPEQSFNTLSNIMHSLGFETRRGSHELSLYTEFNSEKDLTFKENNNNYISRMTEELTIYKDQVLVHELPEIFHYWSNKFLRPIIQDAGYEDITSFFVSNLMISGQRTGHEPLRFVSLGSGNCDLEIQIAQKLLSSGLEEFTIECLDINLTMLDRGKENAKVNGVARNLLFNEIDLNLWSPTNIYDSVLANQSLHHIVELEHVFEQIKKCLHNDGSLIISDMIGRNGHQRWPEALNIVDKYWKELPYNKKYNHILKRFENYYENWDCSREGFEGIRSQDILPLLIKMFKCETFIGFGNVIDIFVDRCFGHNFNSSSDLDKELIDRLHKEDECGFKSGELKPTHLLGVFVNCLHREPYFSRGISPLSAVRET